MSETAEPPRQFLTVRDAIQAGLPAVVAERAGAVWAAAVLALCAGPLPRQAAGPLRHHVIVAAGREKQSNS